ncbi:YoaK family protein [Williamsia sterculiae]|uniref:Uncharacterized membrane protein YoaK, UPF0700 family n=1 Tax=Williamsia sterculiae TaxID=1344003 RepID=A0A1N7HBH9_9NOCA|nr:YoaK family protein [Williamsia sterculiae]SIS22038.1 Uncharacterized membrane protein YoaK, UPF0700 family [Williamsia sterculiae]
MRITRADAVGPEARLSWLLAGVAGMIGAAAFLDSQGYFVTFMTGNTERAALQGFGTTKDRGIIGPTALNAGFLIVAFVAGVAVAMYCRRRFWSNHPHGTTVLTTIGLFVAGAMDLALNGFDANDVTYVPIIIVAFSVGALNAAFVKNGEVSIPLSYVTGTLVKLGQGIERHARGGGTVYDWLGYALLYAGFIGGAVVGGIIGTFVGGGYVLFAAAALCGVTTLVTFFHTDRKTILG